MKVAGYFLFGIFFISVIYRLSMQRLSFFIKPESCRYFCVSAGIPRVGITKAQHYKVGI